MARRVKIRHLELDDFVIDFDASVEDIYSDGDGVWINWSDGDSGYVSNPDSFVEVAEY